MKRKRDNKGVNQGGIAPEQILPNGTLSVDNIETTSMQTETVAVTNSSGTDINADQVTAGQVDALQVRSNSYQNAAGDVEMTPMPTSSAIVGLACAQTLTNKTFSMASNTQQLLYCELARSNATQSFTDGVFATVIFDTHIRSRGMTYGTLAGTAAQSFVTIPKTGWYYTYFYGFTGTTGTTILFSTNTWDNSATYDDGATYESMPTVANRAVAYTRYTYYTAGRNVFVGLRCTGATTSVGHASISRHWNRFMIVYVGE